MSPLSTSVLLVSLILLWKIPFAESKVVKYTLEVSYAQGSPDGVLKRKILKINRQFPGPTIEAEIGDTLQIDLINTIQDRQNTTLHWHGIHQQGSPFEDGPSMITQCPLKYGQTQRYEFVVHQAGTFWYHGHVRSQYSEGLWGALIIRNKPEVYEYDADIVLSLSDWYYQTAQVNEDWYLSQASSGFPPYPDSVMINGRGRYPCDVARIQNRTCRPDFQRRPVYTLRPGKTYRIRVINTSSRASFDFSIDDHKLKAIEVDGVDVARPVSAEIASIAPGQRYSFLITVDLLLDRYLVRAVAKDLALNPMGKNINLFPSAFFPEVTAVLKYAKTGNPQASLVSETTEPFDYTRTVQPRAKNVSESVELEELLLSPYDGIPAPSGFDQQFILNAMIALDSFGIRRFSFNGTPFHLPENRPLLHSIMDDEPLSSNILTPNLKFTSRVQVIISNEVGGHPFHLHGHTFWVLGVGKTGDGGYDSKKHPLTRNGPRRDTVYVPADSWLVIRFIADNPGVWAFHCHIDWHNLSGMALVFIEAPSIARMNLTIPSEGHRLCRS